MINFTSTIAGSCASALCGGSRTCKSSISAPRKIIYSKISSRAGTGRSVGRPSVPKDRTKREGQKNNEYFVFVVFFFLQTIYLLIVRQLIR